MYPLLFSILQVLYPISDINHKRDRPLQVLALGVSRSGTDSLRQALVELGHHDVHHGFRFIMDTHEALQWIRLARAQQTGNKSFLNAAEFDRILGDCMAVTDVPGFGFAHELIDAYPDAKVVLNYREDVDRWYESVLSTVEQFNAGWYDWTLTFFQSGMFWQQRTFYWVWRRWFGNNFPKNGKTFRKEHYERLEARLPKHGYLKWKVEDGWEPLCKFLDKPVPDKPFPSGNTPKEFEARMGALYVQRRAEAERNLRIALGLLITGLTLTSVSLF